MKSVCSLLQNENEKTDNNNEVEPILSVLFEQMKKLLVQKLIL